MKATDVYDSSPAQSRFAMDVLTGLSGETKALSPKYFYDQRGSELFDRICEQPEYYPTRTEMDILRKAQFEIARLAGTGCELIEFGSGASKKIRVLLEGLWPKAYLGIDISRDFLIESTARLAEDYPWLEVHSLCADLCEPLRITRAPKARRVGFFPGSSIGNFEPRDAEGLLQNFKTALNSDGALLIGVDLKKDRKILDSAYNDAQGVTAQFNSNLLLRLKNELGAVLDLDAFEHRAFYNEDLGRIEMHLESTKAQCVRLGNQSFYFDRGERLHTENSYKYTVTEFQQLAWKAGYEPVKYWTDDNELFSLHFLRVTEDKR